jgi:Flp pilus assembly pilin Flp
MSLLLFRWWLTFTGTLHDRLDAARTDERGLTTTEWALLTAGAAAIAIIVIAIVKAKASDAGNNIPISP